MLSRPAPSTSRPGMALEVAASNPSSKAYRFIHKNPKYLANIPTAPCSGISLITRKSPSPPPDTAGGNQAQAQPMVFPDLQHGAITLRHMLSCIMSRSRLVKNARKIREPFLGVARNSHCKVAHYCRIVNIVRLANQSKTPPVRNGPSHRRTG